MFRISDSFSPLPEFGHEIQQTVMPIVAKVDDELIPVGTGFMINRDGLMMTAFHVLEEAERHRTRRRNEQGEYFDYYELYALYITNKPNTDNKDHALGGLWMIDKLWSPQGIDVGFCLLRPATYENKRIFFTPVKLSPGLPKIGEKICGFGYYKPKGIITGELKDGYTVAKYFHETAFTRGEIVEVYPEQRDNSRLNFPCFRTNARFEGGMSGGPIFNQAGSVCGVICSSLPPDEYYPDYDSYATLLWSVMGAEIEGRFDGVAEPRMITIHELIQRGNILVDESINDIIVVKNPDGTRTISVKKGDK